MYVAFISPELKCSVHFGLIWTRNMFNISKLCINSFVTVSDIVDHSNRAFIITGVFMMMGMYLVKLQQPILNRQV